MMSQREIQIWNDAVQACRRAAQAAVDGLEAEAADGMPSPARIVLRAVGAQDLPGDARTALPPDAQAKLEASFREAFPEQFPKNETREG